MPNLLVLLIAVPLFLIAVVLAVSSYRSTGAQFSIFKKLALRALPYAVIVIAALYFARADNDWAMMILEVAFYIALTWIVVWAVRKQWVKR